MSHSTRVLGGSILTGLFVVGLAFLLYFGMLAPDVFYYQRPALLDAAMFQTQAYVLGVTHPTGYTTYLLLAHLFTYLLFTYLPFGDPAFRVSLASAVFGASRCSWSWRREETKIRYVRMAVGDRRRIRTTQAIRRKRRRWRKPPALEKTDRSAAAVAGSSRRCPG